VIEELGLVLTFGVTLFLHSLLMKLFLKQSDLILQQRDFLSSEQVLVLFLVPYLLSSLLLPLCFKFSPLLFVQDILDSTASGFSMQFTLLLLQPLLCVLLIIIHTKGETVVF